MLLMQMNYPPLTTLQYTFSNVVKAVSAVASGVNETLNMDADEQDGSGYRRHGTRRPMGLNAAGRA